MQLYAVTKYIVTVDYIPTLYLQIKKLFRNRNQKEKNGKITPPAFQEMNPKIE